jgi:hypothetical protein
VTFIGFLPEQSKKYVLGILQTESPMEIHYPDIGFVKVFGVSRKLQRQDDNSGEACEASHVVGARDGILNRTNSK